MPLRPHALRGFARLAARRAIPGWLTEAQGAAAVRRRRCALPTGRAGRRDREPPGPLDGGPGRRGRRSRRRPRRRRPVRRGTAVRRPADPRPASRATSRAAGLDDVVRAGARSTAPGSGRRGPTGSTSSTSTASTTTGRSPTTCGGRPRASTAARCSSTTPTPRSASRSASSATCCPSRTLRYVGREGSLALFRKGRPTRADRLRVVAELPWWLRNVFIKVLLRLRLRPVARLFGHDSPYDPY